ncbi:hypothetical protein GCM10027051_01830 [Niabella terrae]
MKQKGIAFLSMVILSLALMALIVVTQFFTNKSTRALNNGNKQAVQTFRTNYSIQELVNLSFDLQSKLRDRYSSFDSTRMRQLTDSLIMLGYNTNILAAATFDSTRLHQLTDSLIMLGYNTNVLASANKVESDSLASKIDSLVIRQVSLSESILKAHQEGRTGLKNRLIDSLESLKPGDQVYANCIAMQALLKTNLQETLVTNNEQSAKLSRYNRALALLAIVAILIMATIIIRRQAQQMRLIEELKAAEAAALKSRNAKDEFLANMSHELRTPLNALIGFGNLLSETTLDSKQKEYVEIVRSSSHNLLNIVNDVLDLSKIEAGKLKINNKPFNLYELFRGLEKMFSRAVTEKDLLYSYRIDENIPRYVVGDPERLKQIFVNLIGNAIKFTNAGGIHVSANIVWIDDNYYKLGFTVKDTGSGIPREKIETIFERFEQLEHGSQRQHGGTGLGLTIVKNLVERMGGSISVFSELGQGSEFNFTCILENAGPVEMENDAVQTPALVFNASNVLIVEDNKANQTLLLHVLHKYGLQPRIADNGQDAVRMLNQEMYDLCFMDIQMPNMDGYTAIELIRNKLNLKLPVIAMTAYVSREEIEKCYQMGFDDYLAKPLDEKLLVEKTSKYLQCEMVEQAGTTQKLSFLEHLVGGDARMVEEILLEMKQQWQTDKADLLNAGKAADINKMNSILHRIKSTFSPLGPNHEVYRIVQHQATMLNQMPEKVSPLNCEGFIKQIENALTEVF